MFYFVGGYMDGFEDDIRKYLRYNGDKTYYTSFGGGNNREFFLCVGFGYGSGYYMEKKGIGYGYGNNDDRKVLWEIED